MLLLELCLEALIRLDDKAKCWIRLVVIFYIHTCMYISVWLFGPALLTLYVFSCSYDYIREMNSPVCFSASLSSTWPSCRRPRRLNTCGYLFRTNGGASSLIDRFRLIRVSATHFKTRLTVLCTFARVAWCDSPFQIVRQLFRNEIGKFTFVCTKIAEDTRLVYN